MARHHIVQDKYLSQWRISDTENQLNIYLIPEDAYKVKGPGWKGFWRDDFNVLDDDGTKSYLPEDITSIVDTKGIEAIKKIDSLNEEQLSGEERSAISFYVALQYIRTPRHREETNKLVQAVTRWRMRKDVPSPDMVDASKEEMLKHVPENEREREALERISLMSDDEIRNQIFAAIHSDIYRVVLTNAGHSKGILKVDRLAKELFEFQWLFLKAAKGVSFMTSDNPCFTISSAKAMSGPLSPLSTTIFPLRPDMCLYIRPNMKSKTESFLELDKAQVQDINKLILLNSYQCLVGKDKKQMEVLTKDFDHKAHRKSRDVITTEDGDYVMFSIE